MELRMCVRSLECVHGPQSVSLEPGSGVWPGYQRTEAGHWLQPGMGSEIPKAGSAPGSAPGHGLSPPTPQPVPRPGSGLVRPPRCLPSPPSPTPQPLQPAHWPPLSHGQRGGLAPPLWRLQQCPSRVSTPLRGSLGGQCCCPRLQAGCDPPEAPPFPPRALETHGWARCPSSSSGPSV